VVRRFPTWPAPDAVGFKAQAIAWNDRTHEFPTTQSTYKMSASSIAFASILLVAAGGATPPSAGDFREPAPGGFGYELVCPGAGGEVHTTRMKDFDCTVAEPAFELSGATAIDPSASSGWRKIGASDELEMYVDDASASRLSSLVGAWIKEVYKQAQASPRAPERFTVRVTSGTYDCRDRTYYEGGSVFYDAHGNEVDISWPSRPERLPPESALGLTFEAFCRQSPKAG